jgi:hypothetical protein
MAGDSALRSIALSHGQARWLLRMLRLRTGDTEATFDAYLKSLRRDGIPFAPDELGSGAGTNLVYRYEHLMELALALMLRGYGILSRDIVKLLAEDRDVLRRQFVRAWREAETGLGERVVLTAYSDKVIAIEGCYLDLGLDATEDGVLVASRPRLLSALDAMKLIMAARMSNFTSVPFPISEVAKRVVELAPHAPEIKRGRPG